MANPDSEPGSVAFADIQEARSRIATRVHRTPAATSATLDAATGARCVLKCENLQRGGAFKIRGATNALLQLDGEARARGVLTYSSGNHAQALALAGRDLHVPVAVVMPINSPAAKRAATAGYGGEVIVYDPAEQDRETLARQLAADRGLPVIPPYDHPHIIAGQGTATCELIEDAGALDVLLVPCGGGGLLSGSAIAAKALAPGCRVIGVEPAAGDDATRSFRTGVLHSVRNPDTIADGARTPHLGEHTFPLVRRFVDDMVTVPDEALAVAMLFVWERLKLIAEPTGVLGLAALLTGVVPAPGRRVGVIVSGGNVDVLEAARIFERFDAAGRLKDILGRPALRH